VVAIDLNDPTWATKHFPDQRFDHVVIADVLEHLLSPLETLTQAVSLLTEEGSVVVSLPHVGNNGVVACLLTYDFDYRDWGLLDRTHLRFFALKNIVRLVEQAGLKIIDVAFVIKAPEKTEFAERWKSLPVLTRVALSRNKCGNVYQVVFKAVRKSASGRPIDLETAKIPAPAKRRGLFKSKRIRKVARALGIRM
jgi:Methyltransferase domain